MHLLDHIRIPCYDPNNPVHQRLAALSAEAHAIMASPEYIAVLGELFKHKDLEQEASELGLDAEGVKHLQALLTQARPNAERLPAIELEIDQLAAQVWGLTAQELEAIR